MRNKILVLVLALVCLLSVSALAAGENVKGKFDPVSQAEITAWWNGANGESAHNIHKYDGENYYTDSNKLYVVAYSLPNCTTKGSISFLCTDAACTAKHDGAWTSASGKTTGQLVKVELAKLGHLGWNDAAALRDYVRPTCEKTGWEEFYCSDCEKVITYNHKSKASDLRRVDTLGKNFAVYYGIQPHSAIKEGGKDKVFSKDATCLEAAYTYNVCEVCDIEFNKTYPTNVLGQHKYVEDTVYVTVETCMNAGLKRTTRICSVCHKADPEAPVKDTVVKQIPHDLTKIFAEYYTPYYPAKTNDAGQAYVWVDEHAEGVAGKFAPKMAIPAEWYVDENGDYMVKTGAYTFTYVPETCTDDGSVTITCEKCNETVTYATEAYGHWGDFNFDEIKDCTKSYDIAFTCRECGLFIKETLAAHADHEYVTKYGTNHFLQYWNNGVLKVEFYYNDEVGSYGYQIEGHPFVADENAAPAECAPYYEVYYCQNELTVNEYMRFGCQIRKLVEVKAADTAKHSDAPADGKYYTNKASTCTVPGVQVYSCAACGDTVTKELELAEHTVAKWSIDTEATCEGPGKASAVCSKCKQPVEKVIPALVHKLEKNETLSYEPETCEPGLLVKTCKNCNVKEETVIPAKHVDEGYEQWQYEEYHAPTCSKAGSKTFLCKNCDVVVTVSIDKLPHNMKPDYKLDAEGKETKELNIQPATCCTGAYYLKKCVNCTAKEAVVVGAALGHKELTKAQKEAIIEMALNNELDDSKYIVKGTMDCENGATATMLCKAPYVDLTTFAPKTCTYEYTIELPALGHDWSNPEKDANGNYYVKCWRCEATKTAEKVKPEYKIAFEGTKGVVTLVNKEQAVKLTKAWVRISYGFELSDGSSIAMVTCMPITFDNEGNGTFSFFALDTALESTGMNCMVVDQYDAMNKTIGQLVGNNYGLYVE